MAHRSSLQKSNVPYCMTQVAHVMAQRDCWDIKSDASYCVWSTLPIFVMAQRGCWDMSRNVPYFVWPKLLVWSHRETSEASNLMCHILCSPVYPCNGTEKLLRHKIYFATYCLWPRLALWWHRVWRGRWDTTSSVPHFVWHRLPVWWHSVPRSCWDVKLMCCILCDLGCPFDGTECREAAETRLQWSAHQDRGSQRAWACCSGHRHRYHVSVSCLSCSEHTLKFFHRSYRSLIRVLSKKKPPLHTS